MEPLTELVVATYPPLDLEERQQWISANAAAASLRALGDAVHALDALDIESRVQVACAAARFHGSRYPAALGWDDTNCRDIAASILLHSSLGFSKEANSTSLVAPAELVPRMLAQLRVLLPAPAGVSSSSGRATKQPSNTRNLEMQEAPSIRSGETMRNPALGAGALLHVSLVSLLNLTASDQGWEANAPAIIPALLALLSVSSPSGRLEAINSLCLLLRNTHARAHLRRTGLVPLITQHLDASASFIFAPLGGALLLASTTARALLPSSGEEEAWEQACCAADSVFRAWAYAPASAPAGLEMPPDEPAGEEPKDTLTASFVALQELSIHLGVAGVARHLGTSFEFLAAHIAEARPGRAAAAADATSALVRVLETAPSKPPGLRAWTGRILTSVAKAWVVGKEENKAVSGEQASSSTALIELCRAFLRAEPESSREQLERILALDCDVFEALISPALKQDCTS